MKIIMKGFLTVTIFLFMMSCDNKEESDIFTIDIDNAIDVNHHALMEAIESIEFIPLETNTENLMGFINRVSLINDHIYIFDHLSNKIHIFNSTGKWLNTLNKKGKGPGEYLYIKNFRVDENGALYVMTHGKILMYNKDLHFIGEIIIPDDGNKIRDFYLFGKENIIFYKTYNKNGDNSLLQHFKSNKIIKQYGQITTRDNFGHNRFVKYNDKINFIPPFYSNDILSIDENFNIIKKYRIKLNNKSLKNSNSNIKLKHPKGIKNYMILTFLETDRYIYFAYNGTPIQHCLYNKTTGSCYKSIKSWSKEKYGFTLNAYNTDANNNYLLGIESSIVLINNAKDLKADTIINEEQVKTIKELKVTDNPVVIKIKLKP